ncbi:MAG TPA: M20/M25/M40 family metallo-hydrolase [Gaiellaceae bacterium]|nr:M20/M25/M40 family metallo-hydrolase [Gaiellaceae bacterium]
MASTTIRDEAVGLLQELLRLDTVNPPGNETVAAELLRDYLGDSGVSSELYALEPERASLVARIPGRGEGPSLLLLSHTDTVVADPAEWSVDPWCGEVRDGCVWGRGALDMKGHVAAAAAAIATLAREGFEPAGDLVFAATADEEVGVDVGLSWLVRAHPEAVRTDFCVNEGGGERVVLGDRPVYVCTTAEKVSAPFRLKVHGRSGHASMPGIADNALVRAAGLIQRLAALRLPPRLIPETEALFAALGEVPPASDLEHAVAELPSDVRELVEPMLGTALSPTMISASQRTNVIPGLCEVVCDCRLLPGDTPEGVEPAIRAALGEDVYDLEWIEAVGGTRSPLATPLWDAIEAFVAEDDPRAAVVPIVSPGFTDSHFLRQAFGTVAYGFFPMRTMDADLAARLVHSADERIAVEDLELGVRFLRHVAATLGA